MSKLVVKTLNDPWEDSMSAEGTKKPKEEVQDAAAPEETETARDADETTTDVDDGDAVDASATGSTADPITTDAKAIADAAGAAAAKAKSSLSSLFSSIHKGWDEYTEDVRQHEANADTTATQETVRNAAPVATGAVAGEQSPVTTRTTAPAQLLSPVTVVKGVRGVAGSFLDGVLGRPQPTVVNDAKTGKRAGVRLAFKVITGVFAVIGLLAVFRASVDAFRPRR